MLDMIQRNSQIIVNMYDVLHMIYVLLMMRNGSKLLLNDLTDVWCRLLLAISGGL